MLHPILRFPRPTFTSSAAPMPLRQPAALSRSALGYGQLPRLLGQWWSNCLSSITSAPMPAEQIGEPRMSSAPEEDRQKALALILSQIQARFGKGAMMLLGDEGFLPLEG